MGNETPDRDEVLVRNLRPEDQEAVIAIDARSVGRRRDEFFKLKLRQAFADTGIAVSLAAELDGRVAGFLLARVYYGEFGLTERTAVMDVLGVHPDSRGRHVAAALIDQLRTNLQALGIRTLQTEVAWDSPELLTFFQHEGFRPAARLCLDLDLERTRQS
jgi:ribosomal protein S18 acetylase RimI-like enzyme